MAEAAHAAELICRNCGHALSGAYCSSCGQSEHDGHPPTIGHFTHDLLHEFLHVDGAIFRTLKALFFQPGKLTAEYWAGHVVSWVRPIRIFLVVVALHLLISTGVGPLNFHLTVTKSTGGDLHFSVNSGTDVQLKSGTIAVPEDQRREFFEKFGHAYATIRYSSVLLFAGALWLLYRGRQPYFVNNLIAGLHFYSFWYAIAMVGSLMGRLHPLWNDLSFVAPVYLFLMLRFLFHERWYVVVVKTLALYVFLIAVELALGIAAGSWTAHSIPR